MLAARPTTGKTQEVARFRENIKNMEGGTLNLTYKSTKPIGIKDGNLHEKPDWITMKIQIG